jgi:hypothetical protein
MRAIIRESARRQVIINSYAAMCDKVISESRINELDISGMAGSATSFLGDNLGGSFIRSIKQYLIELLFNRLAAMGLPISTTSIVGRALVNTLQQVEWTDLSKYFADEGACGEVADVLLTGVQEGIQEKGIDELVSVMFGVEGRRLDGPLGSPIRELINIQIESMTNDLRDPIKDFLCDHRDIKKLMAGFKSGLGVKSDSGSGSDGDGPARFILKDD